MPGEACGWSEEWTPFTAAWRKELGPEVRRSAGAWGAEACGNGRAGQNRTPRAAGWRGEGGSWTSSRGRGLPGQVSEAGAQGPSLGGFQECAQRREWAVGNATLLGPKPVEAARPDGLPRRGHGAHEAGQEKPGSPFLHPSPPPTPRRKTSLFKSPAFLLPHRTQGLRTNPLVTVTFPKRRRAGHTACPWTLPRFAARDPR